MERSVGTCRSSGGAISAGGLLAELNREALRAAVAAGFSSTAGATAGSRRRGTAAGRAARGSAGKGRGAAVVRRGAGSSSTGGDGEPTSGGLSSAAKGAGETSANAEPPLRRGGSESVGGSTRSCGSGRTCSLPAAVAKCTSGPTPEGGRGTRSLSDSTPKNAPDSVPSRMSMIFFSRPINSIPGPAAHRRAVDTAGAGPKRRGKGADRPLDCPEKSCLSPDRSAVLSRLQKPACLSPLVAGW